MHEEIAESSAVDYDSVMVLNFQMHHFPAQLDVGIEQNRQQIKIRKLLQLFA